ncbi:hypothetical protein [Streptomyces sp. NBC_01497]|uniref:hypothetical protein n=1 Tax=Streptomyces sp. NBC_01497 TaxID=2903885 RepID=UPI002E318F70|nr:hypothetical protein [Streptomyces sp. NBC_01497]
MADAVEPTTEDNEAGNEVEAHAATPLELQEMGLSQPDKGTDGLVAGNSSVSAAVCA